MCIVKDIYLTLQEHMPIFSCKMVCFGKSSLILTYDLSMATTVVNRKWSFPGDSEDNFASSPSDRLTPPSSPRLIKEKSDLGSNYDPVDLQLDYWAVVSAAAEFGNVSSSGKPEQTSAKHYGTVRVKLGYN